MATDSERLLINIEASQAKITRQLAAIAKAAGATAGGVERDFQRSNDNVAKGFDRTAAAARKAAQAQESAFRQSRAVATNLSFQLQDIAQGLMVGTSPFTLMAQQGGQVVQALSMAPGGAGGAVKSLGSAVVGLINPMSLATFAIIGLGAAAVQYFTSLLNDGGLSNKELKEQEQRIQAIADKWGAAFPALRRYADERARLQTIEGVREATQAEIVKQYEEARKVVAKLREDVVNLQSLDQLIGGIRPGQFNAASREITIALNDLDDALAANKATAADAERVISAISDVFGSNLPNNAQAAVTSLQDLAKELANAKERTEELLDQEESFKLLQMAFQELQQAIDRVNSDSARQELQKLYSQAKDGEISIEDVRTALGNLSGMTPDLSGAIGALTALFNQAIATQSAINNLAGGGGPLTRGRGRGQQAGDTLSGGVILPGSVSVTPTGRQDPYFHGDPAKKASSRGARTSEAEREAEAIAKLIENLEHEIELLGQSAEQQAVMNNLRKLAASATDEQKGKVEELTRTLFRQKEAQQEANRVMEDMRSLGKDVLGGFIRDIKNGTSATEALSNALGKVADKLLDMALNNLFSGKGFGGGGKGGLFGGFLIPGILHSGGVAGRDGYGHGRAVSPSVFTGAKRYHKGGIAGLQPGEVPAILQRGEVVLPRGTKAGTSQPANVRVEQHYHISGAISSRDVQQMVEQGAARSIDTVKRSLTSWQGQIARDGAI